MRSGDWQWGASIQQELLPRVSVELVVSAPVAGEFPGHRQPRARPRGSHQFSIITPTDSRLPDGGGYTIDGLYNVTAAAAARLNDNFQTLDRNFAQQTQGADTISLNVTARPRLGLTVQGGFNTANNPSDSCGLRDAAAGDRPDQSLVQHLDGVGHALYRAGDLHRPEGRHPRLGHGPQRPGPGARRELGSTEFGHRRPGSAVRRRRSADDHRQPDRTGHALRRPRQRSQPALRQDSPVRRHAQQCRRRSLQRVQRGTGAHLQPDVLADGDEWHGQLAPADVSAAGALHQGERADRLLNGEAMMNRRDLLERAGGVFVVVGLDRRPDATTSIVTPTTGPGVSRAAGQTPAPPDFSQPLPADILDAFGGPRP